MDLFKKFFKRYKKNLLIFLILFLSSFFLFRDSLDFAFTPGDFTNIWTPTFNPKSIYLYWSHPSVVFELFLLYKLFGINHIAFNLFGIVLRSTSAFAGYLFISKLTKSNKIGFLCGLFFASSYIGQQATTWVGVHINYFDLIFVLLTSYRFLIYLSSDTKKNFIYFLLSFTLALVSDPGRDFPVLAFIAYLFIFDAYGRKIKNIYNRIDVKKLGLLICLTLIIFIVWFTFFHNFYGGSVTHHHKRIPFETVKYFFGSMANFIITPLLRPFEYSLDNSGNLELAYLLSSFAIPFLWIYSTYKFLKTRSKLTANFSILLVWMFLFYFPNWISYPRTYVSAVHRYTTITGFGFVAIATILCSILFKKNKLLCLSLIVLIFIINIITVNYYLNQESEYRPQKVQDKIFMQIVRNVSKTNRQKYFYLKGSEPLTSYGVVPFLNSPLILQLTNRDSLSPNISTKNIEKIANELCHNNIKSLDKLKQVESNLNFYSWNIKQDGVVIDNKMNGLNDLESVFSRRDVCSFMRKKYGDKFIG